ncbi:hypothetical protein PF003_g16629 [Phytophthora fragariae]|nr:hypothetical protein PF003_g16629 [Phytophthora fragariae]
MVELRRRRRSNKAGHYILEYELRPERVQKRRRDKLNRAVPQVGVGVGDEERRWVSVKEYDRLLQLGRVVEEYAGGEEV